MATNKNNGKRYIGVTSKGMHHRRMRHEANAARGREGKFYDALRKYGSDAFIWSVLCTRRGRAEAFRREYLYVDALKPEYNMVPGGSCPTANAGGANRVAVMCLEDGLVFESAHAAAKHYGVGVSQISNAYNGYKRACRNKHFIRADVALSEEERMSLCHKMDADWYVAHRKVKTHFYGKKRPTSLSKRVMCVNDGMVFDTVRCAARHYTLNPADVGAICRGDRNRKITGPHRLSFKFFEN